MSESAPPEAPLENLDQRQQGVITEARFFEPYREELHALFTALGMEEHWSDDLRDLLPYVHAWIGAEHGPNGKQEFTQEQTRDAKEALRRMGLIGEIPPPARAHFDTIIVLGATRRANERRLAFVIDAMAEYDIATGKMTKPGVTADTVMFWAGQRPREERDGDNWGLLAPDDDPKHHNVLGNPGVQEAMTYGRFMQDDPWSLTETDLACLALFKLVDGNMRPTRIGFDDDDTPISPDVPKRWIRDIEFEDQHHQRYVVMNAAAVDRGEGRPPRHTTASSALEWLENYDPPEGAEILFVSSNPHTIRTAQDVYQVFAAHGRGDIRVTVCGPAGPENLPLQTMLGEVARLLENEIRRYYPASHEPRWLTAARRVLGFARERG